MIIEEIKKANIEAMKSKNSNLRTIYSVVINKYMQLEINNRTTGQATTDADMVKLIVKTIKELDEESANYQKVNNMEEVKNIEEQKAALTKYLPEMLSKEKIKENCREKINIFYLVVLFLYPFRKNVPLVAKP